MSDFQCAAILFDLDGVLVDSTQAIITIWTAWAEKNHLDPAKVLHVIHGRRTVESLQVLAPHLDPKSEAEKLESAITHKKDGTVAIPGAANLLRSLPTDRWCVVTSGLREFAKVRLKDANLPLPQVLVAAEDVINGKPHPEPYLKGAQLLKADPAKCVVIEDAPAGIRSAHAGGMKALGITTTYAAAELGEADAVIQTMSQVRVSLREGQLQIQI